LNIVYVIKEIYTNHIDGVDCDIEGGIDGNVHCNIKYGNVYGNTDGSNYDEHDAPAQAAEA
jgi:hypothetical protein